MAKLGTDNVFIATSCSLLHCPYDLDKEKKMDAEVLQWLAFAKQKLAELDVLKNLANGNLQQNCEQFTKNQQAIECKKTSKRTNNPAVRQRASNLKAAD